MKKLELRYHLGPGQHVRMSDVNEGVKIDADTEVKFKVYVDEGVGAYEVDQA